MSHSSFKIYCPDRQCLAYEDEQGVLFLEHYNSEIIIDPLLTQPENRIKLILERICYELLKRHEFVIFTAKRPWSIPIRAENVKFCLDRTDYSYQFEQAFDKLAYKVSSLDI